MTSSRGVIQGYNGLAVVDDRAQIVVHAEAHGSGYEAHLLAPTIEATRKNFAEIEPGKDVFATGADAYVADRDYRQREPAFAGAARHKARDKKERGLRRRREREARESTEPQLFTVKDFVYNEANARCIRPAG
jgi:hypothetical protein